MLLKIQTAFSTCAMKAGDTVLFKVSMSLYSEAADFT